MSTPCINEAHSRMSYKWNTLNLLSNLHSCRTLNDPKMAPTVEQEKNTGNGELVAEHPDEQYTSTETSSSNNSYVQPDNKEDVSKLRNCPLTGSPSSETWFEQAYYASLRNVPTLEQMKLPPANSTVIGSKKLLFDGRYPCVKCDFVGHNDDELHEHAIRHDPYECSSCGFLADKVNNLKEHFKHEHPEINPNSWNDNIIYNEAVESASTSKKKSKEKPFAENFEKPRKTPCKLCNDFIGDCKLEYYTHLQEVHEGSGRLLPCNLCPFIALYKHHLEYHFRNHYGSKPYMCDRCDYKCVNRSMLNSHNKSHSDIYQYACKNCSYMTKYLHSLKMHLRKYNHEPGRTLNPDGSVNGNTIIDVHGKRRGPKSKKRKRDSMDESSESPKSKFSPSPPSSSNQLPSQNIRILYNPKIYNNYTGNLYVRSEPSEASNYNLHSPPNIGGTSFKCAYCEFVAGTYDIYRYHMFTHVSQNQTSNNNASPHFPYFVPPHNLNSLFPAHYGTESFPRNGLNQSKIGENRDMDAANNDFYFQNSSNVMYRDQLRKTPMDEKESPINGMAIPPKMYPFYDYQYPKVTFWKPEDNTMKLSTSPNATITVKDEIPETMDGIRNSLANNSTDNAPLDLSLKQPLSPETKSNGTLSPYRQSPGATTDRAPSASPKSGNESTVSTRKANRRKGRAFKLNQYTMESDPASDCLETELGKMRVLSETSHSNETHSKPAFRSEIKKSVPRINFKPTLNTAKWNGHNSHESKQPEVQFMTGISNLIPNKFEPDSMEPNDDASSQTEKRTALDISNDSWCSSCSMYQGNASLLLSHSTFHSEDDPFTCAKCGLRCHNRDNFLHHILDGSRINGKCINAKEHESYFREQSKN